STALNIAWHGPPLPARHSALRLTTAGERTGAARPPLLVRVIGELQMVRAEAGVDRRVFHGLRVEHCDLSIVALDRERLGRRMLRAFSAERRIVRTAYRGREPHAALPVEHRVVVVDLRIPDLLVAPIG